MNFTIRTFLLKPLDFQDSSLGPERSASGKLLLICHADRPRFLSYSAQSYPVAFDEGAYQLRSFEE